MPPTNDMRMGDSEMHEILRLREELSRVVAENAERQQKILSLILERDQYRHQAEQKLALRREVEALLGIASAPCSDEQFSLGVERLREIVAENAKLLKVAESAQEYYDREDRFGPAARMKLYTALAALAKEEL